MNEIQKKIPTEEEWEKATQGEYLTFGEDDQKDVEVSFNELVEVTKDYDGTPKLIWELRLNVHKIDGTESVTNKWEISSRPLIEKLKPIIKPISGTTNKVTVRVVRTGKGAGTKWVVKQVH